MRLSNNIPIHHNGDLCPCCGEKKKGILTLKVSKFKSFNGFMQFYLICETCRYTVSSKYTGENGLEPRKRVELAKTL